MDDSLLAEFQSTFMIGGDVLTNTHGPHPHYTLYKQRGAGGGFGSQDQRRKKSLEEQKARRRNYADYARRIVEGDLSVVEDDEMEEGAFDEVDKGTRASAQDNPKKQQTAADATVYGACKKAKRRSPYRNQLMLSEWLVDIPADFDENWYFVVCPIGKRCLVVSGHGTTSAYNRAGEMINNFPSLLPGGCLNTYRVGMRDYCLLDCIYHEVSRTFHVLDIMCWSGLAVYDSDMEFRSYWKATKLRDEEKKLSKYSRRNPLIFQDLIYRSCSKESFSEVLGGAWPLEVDGLLFIHKGAHYTVGRSPLAAWLKPEMIPDILKIPVSKEFLSSAPSIPATAAAMDTSRSMDVATAKTSKSKGKRSKKKRDKKMDSSMSIDSVVSDEATAIEPIEQ